MSKIIKKHLNFDGAFITEKEYEALYQQSIEHPTAFWAEQAKKYVDWIEPWEEVVTGDFFKGESRWFTGAKLNVCYNCVDRHLPERANQTAIIWEGDEPTQSGTLTYQELYEQVCQLANGFKALGIKKGDRICIYMPMIPEAAIAMLACARIGAVHSVVFGGFSPEALKNRIQDAECMLVITADANVRGGKHISLKANVDEIIDQCPSVKHVVVVNSLNQKLKKSDHDIDYNELINKSEKNCPIEIMDAIDPLFILYTSGSTGRPKGILHGQGGYLLYVTMTFKLVFNYQEGDVYWCTADVGWITGHSYLVYGPLANGATTLMFAGVPSYPNASRFWNVIDKHQVNIFYTAPTAIRTLMREGDAPVSKTSRETLKLLGTVGEPINPEAWLWYYNVVGEKRCPIVDTWWQTETGGIMIMPLPGATALKPGSASKPFFGVELAIIDEQGKKIIGEASGNLVITKPWPGQLQTIYGDAKRSKATYFPPGINAYLTGDNAERDVDDYYWITGRTDDVLNVSGHRLDTAEIESALVAHKAVTEAAVVGFPHEIKGQAIFAFVTTKPDVDTNDELKKELVQWVRKIISPIATPDKIQWVEDLPKTRSGKIMRRILRKIVNKQADALGDISTLSNPEVVEKIIVSYNSNKN